MAIPPVDFNRAVYERPDVVECYRTYGALAGCEKPLFDRWLAAGMDILDIGVGGGRTVPYLSAVARRYVGIDYSAPMVEICRQKFPVLDLRVADATDLSQFNTDAFDGAVFSFNGIDAISTDEGRARCFSEVARLLKPGGVFIFSSHNSRMVFAWPVLDGMSAWRKPLHVALSFVYSARIINELRSKSAYSRGCAYIRDPSHGGIGCYYSSPRTITPQIARAGLELVATMGINHPMPMASAPWIYYVARKPTLLPDPLLRQQ